MKQLKITAELDPVELAWLRCRKIGYIFQTFNLIGTMTALENVMLPMAFAGLTSDEALDRGVEILTHVGLGDRCKHRPWELSGGWWADAFNRLYYEAGTDRRYLIFFDRLLSRWFLQGIFD